MANHIGYWAVSFSEDGEFSSFELTDDEFFCNDGCMEAALDGLTDRNWMPYPLDTAWLIGPPANNYGKGLTWAAECGVIELPAHPAFGVDFQCGACGAYIGPRNTSYLD